jgi:hypothetical protein
MARWDTPFEIEKVKQPALIAALPTHHDPTSSLKHSTKRNHDSPIISTTFSTLSATSGLMRRKISSSHCRVGVENESAADILFAFGPELELKEGVEYDRMPLPSLEL